MAIIKRMGKIKDPKNMIAKMKVFTSAIKAVTSLMTFFTGPIFKDVVKKSDDPLMSTVEEQSKPKSPLMTAIDNMKAFSDNVLKKGGPLDDLLSRLSKIKIPAGLAKNIKTLKPALDMLSKMMNIAGSIKKLKEDNPGLGTGIFSKPTANLFTEMSQVTDKMTTGTQKLSGAVSKIRLKSLQTTAKHIKTMISEHNKIHARLNKMKKIDVDAIITEVNKSLELKKDKFTVKHQAVNIQVNLNVTMKAEEIAKVMVEQKLLAPGPKSESKT